MIIKFCELFLEIVLNVFLYLNRKKIDDQKVQVLESKEDSILLLLNEIKSIESERKLFLLREKESSDELKHDLRMLNERLRSIEYMLYEKREGLLKEKNMGNNYGKDDEG